MKTHTILHLTVALVATGATAAAQGAPLGFDLIRINDDGHPEHPGIDYDWFPATELAAEAPGVAVADIDNDGLLDVVIGANEVQNTHVYMNNGDGTFTESAVAMGIDDATLRRGHNLLFDYDNDGDLDMASFGYPGFPYYNLDLYSFYRNDGAPGYGFTDVTAGVGGFVLGPSAETTVIGVPGGSAAADYDADGYVDMIATYWYRNSEVLGWDRDQFRLWHNTPNPQPDGGEPDYSGRLFEDVTQAAGLDELGIGWIWEPTFNDIDHDGLPDLHINVEAGMDLMLMNQGDGTFGPDISMAVGLNFNCPCPPFQPGGPGGNEMGATWADHDNDGDLDLYLTNPGLGPANKNDAFYRNDSDFSEGGAGLSFTHMANNTVVTDSDDPGWGIVFPDLDNDGDKDIVTSRGMGVTLIGRQYVWRNNFPVLDGPDPAYEDVTLDQSGLSACFDAARALVAFDYDNDGDQDLLMTRTGAVPPHPADRLDAAMYRNENLNSADWLQVDLVEAGGSLNTIGAQVFIRTGGVNGVTQMQEIGCGTSFLSQEPSRLHFGLRFFGEAEFVAVRWFDGGLTVLTDETDTLAGLIQIARGAEDASGDLDGDADVDADDLELLVLALVDEQAVNALVPDSWPWRITADVDDNGLLDRRDFAIVRAMVADTFVDVGQALGGTLGEPALTGTGDLSGGSAVALDVTGALPSSLAWLFLGFDLGLTPLKGGVLVPTLDLPAVGPFPVDGAGDLHLPATWPTGVPGGLITNFQVFVADPGGPFGAAGTNGLSGITP